MGPPVGSRVGWLEGWPVGCREGCEEGWLLGCVVGSPVGELVELSKAVVSSRRSRLLEVMLERSENSMDLTCTALGSTCSRDAMAAKN